MLSRVSLRNKFSIPGRLCSGIAVACFITLALSTTAFSASDRTNPSNLIGHGGPIKAITINQAGTQALTGSFDYSAALWQLNRKTANRLVRRYADHDGAVNAVRFMAADRQFISAGDDGIIYLWDTKSGKLLFKFKGHRAKVLSLAVSENGKIVASASWDRTVRVWDIERRKLLKTLVGHKGPVNGVLISGDEKFVYSGGYDGAIIKWEIASGEMIRALYRHGWGINVMAWLPGRQQILFGTVNGDVQIFDLATDTISKILIPHQRPVLALAVSKDGRYLASGGADGVIRVWKISDWSVVEELYSSFGPVWAMDFSADNKTIFYAGLDDYAVAWKISPRNVATEVQGKFPRRFQKFKDMSLGERQFARKCSVCHTLKPGDRNRAGPSLFGVFGRVAGTLKGYKYSAGLVKSQIIWDEGTIDQLFALGPQHVTPGSKMPLQQIREKNKRQALIRFLKANTQ